MNAPVKPFTDESTSVQGHLTTMQGVINRMATNSASVKAWCVSLVAAILVLVGDEHKPKLLWITVVPIGLFFWLDAYYLMLEQGFRESYKKFVTKLHAGTLRVDDLYEIKPDKSGLWGVVQRRVVAVGATRVRGDRADGASRAVHDRIGP